MLIKILFVGLLVLVIFSLFQALFNMIKNDTTAPKMSKLLGRRVFFSVVIIFILIVLLATGVITPHSRPY